MKRKFFVAIEDPLDIGSRTSQPMAKSVRPR